MQCLKKLLSIHKSYSVKSACRHFLTLFFHIHPCAYTHSQDNFLTFLDYIQFKYISWDTDQCLHSHGESSHIAAHLRDVKLANSYEKRPDSLMILVAFSPILLKNHRFCEKCLEFKEWLRNLISHTAEKAVHALDSCSTTSYFALQNSQSVSLYIHGPIGDETT